MTTSYSSIPIIQIEEELPESFRIPASDIRIGEQIGRGGFSTVHKAFWRGQACAAKVVQTTDVRAIQKEVAILSKLDHPHVIRCIGFSVDDDTVAGGPARRCMILMELMDGDLRHIMNKRLAHKLFPARRRSKVPFTESEAVNILEQIASGMEYLHEQRVFHGDLKASNILVGPHMHVKITDFGVSMMVKRDPSKNSQEFVRTKHFRGVVGTSGYVAPEVVSSSSIGTSRHVGTAYYSAPEVSCWRPNDFYTVKADVYSFAMTCYEILSGCVPFEDVRRGDVAGLVSRGVRPVLPKLEDRRLVELIGQCWHRKPSKRPGFEEIRASLVAVQQKERTGKKVVHYFPCIDPVSNPQELKAAGLPRDLYSCSIMDQPRLPTIMQTMQTQQSFAMDQPRLPTILQTQQSFAMDQPGLPTIMQTQQSVAMDQHSLLTMASMYQHRLLTMARLQLRATQDRKEEFKQETKKARR